MVISPCSPPRAIHIGQPEFACAIAETVVPFRERNAEFTGTPAVRAAIPWFHDHFEIAEQHVGAQSVQEWMVAGEFTVETCKRRREIESESVDANAFGPIAQRIHGERGDVRVGEIKRIAAAGGIVQATHLVFGASIVRQIVKSTPTYGRSFRSGFAGVVVDHVHNHFETGLVQCAHHVNDFLAYGGGAGLLRAFGGI